MPPSTPSTPLKTAFLGTGLMGAPMAGRLIDKTELRAVWNRSSDKTAGLAARGVAVASTPIAAATGIDILCLCLTDGPAVSEIMFGPDGPAGLGAAAPRLVIDFTTSSPRESEQLAAEYARMTGGEWLDAPVSGGLERAEAGTLVIFCGGSQSAFEQAWPVLDILASRITLVGSQGAGQTLKLVAQLIAAPTIAAIAEALAAAEANGLDPAAIPDLLAGGLADSPLLQIFGRKMVQTDAMPIGAIATMYKDIAAATGMARTSGILSPVADAAAAAFRELSAEGDRDLAYLFTHRRRRDDG
jgi:3-hydroxyisobutyrate dehydrogenase